MCVYIYIYIIERERYEHPDPCRIHLRDSPCKGPDCCGKPRKQTMPISLDWTAGKGVMMSGRCLLGTHRTQPLRKLTLIGMLHITQHDLRSTRCLNTCQCLGFLESERNSPDPVPEYQLPSGEPQDIEASSQPVRHLLNRPVCQHATRKDI